MTLETDAAAVTGFVAKAKVAIVKYGPYLAGAIVGFIFGKIL
jgi:hypothetical protein